MPNDPALYGSGETSDDAQRKAVTPEKKAEKPKRNELVAKYWREIKRYDRMVGEWHEEGETIEKVYLDEMRTSNDTRRFALLWANIETLKPAVHAKLPTVMCARRYKDRDPVGRIAAELMERATNTSWDLYGADETFKMMRDDRLLPGRGQGWVRYEATIERTEEMITVVDPVTQVETTQMQVREKLTSEKVCNDYVHWQDFGHNVARVWAEVWLVWRIVYKTQEEVTERFGSEKAAKLKYTAKAPMGSAGAYDGTAMEEAEDNRCKIYELWDKMRGLTAWLADEGQGKANEFLESGPPPIDFRKGFPCPEPCYATKTSKQLIPRPDYRYYRDQAKEINDLTDKIGRLTQWLIVKGFVPGGPSTVADPIEEALRDKTNAELFVQVDSWKEWTERGGTKGLIDWLPIQAVVAALQAAIQARNQLIQDVFQLTGISDILRGQTDPNETLGAQELKAQTGSRRQKNIKDDIARWCKDMALLNAEVIAEKFEPQSIAEITGFKYVPTPVPAQAGMQPSMLMLPHPGMPTPGMGPMGLHVPGTMPPPQPMNPIMGHNGGPPMMGMEDDGEDALVFGDEVMELLRNDKMRSFRIDVETDQTGQADENLEKQRRTELLNVVGGFMEKSVQVVAQVPELGQVIKEMLMLAMRGFKTGKTLEDTLDRGLKQAMVAARQARQQAQQQGDPKMIEAKANLALKTEEAKANVALAQQKQQGDMALQAHKHRADAAAKVETAKIDAQLAEQKQQTDAMLEIRKQNLDAAAERRQANLNAAAQARERADKILGSLKSGTVQ